MSLKPWYIVGLIEGEGCFCITISRHQTKKLGFDARLMFEIEMIIDVTEEEKEFLINLVKWDIVPEYGEIAKIHKSLLTKLQLEDKVK